MRKPVQLAYFVEDVRTAALQHSKMFGSGPFYVAEHIQLSKCIHRGKQTDWDHTSAFGQWGDVMLEFMQQNQPGPSALRDVFPEGSGRYGMHHMAYFVDDIHGLAADWVKQGCPIALEATLTNGIELVMIDATARFGHMLEFYAPTKTLLDVYEFVRAASVDFDGKDPVREIEL